MENVFKKSSFDMNVLHKLASLLCDWLHTCPQNLTLDQKSDHAQILHQQVTRLKCGEYCDLIQHDSRTCLVCWYDSALKAATSMTAI